MRNAREMVEIDVEGAMPSGAIARYDPSTEDSSLFGAISRYLHVQQAQDVPDSKSENGDADGQLVRCVGGHPPLPP